MSSMMVSDERKKLIDLVLFFEETRNLVGPIRELRQVGVCPPKSDLDYVKCERVILSELGDLKEQVIEARKPKKELVLVPNQWSYKKHDAE